MHDGFASVLNVLVDVIAPQRLHSPLQLTSSGLGFTAEGETNTVCHVLMDSV